MANFLLYKTTSPAVQKAKAALATDAVSLVLKGQHRSVKEAFAFDKALLQEISSRNGGLPLLSNFGVMAGKARRR
jgi:hypothetical protein